MAASSGFQARVYGMVQGTPPFTDKNGNTAFSRVIAFNSAQIQSFPSGGETSIFGLPNGIVVGGAYVYSVISLQPTGLNVHGQSFVSDSSEAALATLRG